MKTFDSLLADLNESQYKAATFENKHCMVLAGAVCGKTKTIIARAIYLISQGIQPNKIQILSFTRKSASEIYERIRISIGEDRVRGLHTSTFHTWCLSIIRANAKLFGKENFTILDRDDQLQIFRLYRGRHAKGTFPTAEQIIELYSFSRNTRKSLSSAFETHLPEYRDLKENVATIMKNYETKKQENQYIDYDDILDFVAVAVNNYPEFAEYIGKQFDYILVDEMQDTNPLQWALLEPIAKYSTLFCVGDDAQSIYGFRGADFKNVHSFTDRIPNSEILKLEDNYRSTQEILDLSNWLLSKSPLNYDKNLKSVRGDGKKPELHDFDDEWEQSRFIAETLEERKSEGFLLSENLILVRSSADARPIETALIQKNIPYMFIGGLKMLEAAHIKDVLSVLRICVNFKDEIAWMRYLLLWQGIGEKTASEITTDVVDSRDFNAVLEKLKNYHSKYGFTFEVINTIKEVLKNKSVPKESVFVAIQNLTPILAETYRNSQWNKRKKDFDSLIKLAEKFGTLIEFVDSCICEPLNDADIVPEQDKNDDRVTISTIHSAKGMERRNCYVVNVSIGNYPSSKNIDSIEELEEERRVLYVALTRAKDELFITRISKALFAFDSQNSQKLEERYFLNGLPENLVTIINHKKAADLPESFKFGKPLNIKVGIDFS